MSLAEIVADVATKHEKAGIIDRDAAVNEALPRVMAEPFTVEHIVRRHLSNSIKQHLTKVRDAAVDTFGSKQGSLFELRPAHVLAGDDGIIKSTRSMTRIEFQGLIKVRERQVEDDLTYLARLKFAADETGFIWDRHPDWSWGQIEDAYSRMKKAA